MQIFSRTYVSKISRTRINHKTYRGVSDLITALTLPRGLSSRVVWYIFPSNSPINEKVHSPPSSHQQIYREKGREAAKYLNPIPILIAYRAKRFGRFIFTFFCCIYSHMSAAQWCGVCVCFFLLVANNPLSRFSYMYPQSIYSDCREARAPLVLQLLVHKVLERRSLCYTSVGGIDIYLHNSETPAARIYWIRVVTFMVAPNNAFDYDIWRTHKQGSIWNLSARSELCRQRRSAFALLHIIV